MQGVLAAIAAGMYREVEIELAAAQHVKLECTRCEGSGVIFDDEGAPVECDACDGNGWIFGGEIAEPAQTLRLRVRKLDSEKLAEQGTAILFTDLPANLGVLAGGDPDIAAIVEGDNAAAKTLQDQIGVLQRLGPKFFKQQAKQHDAIVCAGVVAVWQVWNGPEDAENPPPNVGKPGALSDAVEAGGYWRDFRLVLSDSLAEPERGRFPITVLSKGAREKLAREISAFSLDDGGIADAMRGFRRES